MSVEVWRLVLDADAGVLSRHRRSLSSDELARADRFLVERPRRELILTRGVLRCLLAERLGARPEDLRFEYGPDGKPALVGGGVSFNVSHSHGGALIALAAQGTLGVDLERVSRDLDHEQIAERYFSVPERRALRALPPAERPAAFFRCWTRKEAWLKAKGTGLRLPLADFDVSLGPDEPARLLATRFDDEEAARWSLVDIEAGEDFAAALAWLGEAPVVELFDWEEPPG